MDFDLTEDQKEIKRVAHELLAARSPFAKVREAAESGSYETGLWTELVELGWPGIAVAEEHGGQGLGTVELAVLAEELGYACAATPLVPAAAAGLAIQAGGTSDQQARWLPGLVRGELRGGVGTRQVVADGPGADVIVLLDGDHASALADPAVSRFHAIDPTRRYGSVEDDAAGAGSAAGSDSAALGAGAADRVRTVLAAEVLGVCQRALEMTLDYVKDRKQFGLPVGSFQAVSHRCAQMLLNTESVRSATYFAAWAADADPDRLPEAAAMAAAAAAQSAHEVTASAIQAHGGIGFTWEADVHWLYKRAQLDVALLGGARRHRAGLARLAAARVAVPALR
jgi:alkylation response protein AidB-like acyl-CoA dehydrogenase